MLISETKEHQSTGSRRLIISSQSVVLQDSESVQVTQCMVTLFSSAGSQCGYPGPLLSLTSIDCPAAGYHESTQACPPDSRLNRLVIFTSAQKILQSSGGQHRNLTSDRATYYNMLPRIRQ